MKKAGTAGVALGAGILLAEAIPHSNQPQILSPPSSLATLTDIQLSGLSDRQLLMYILADGKWENQGLIAADIPNLDTSKLTTGLLPVARGGTHLGGFSGAGDLLYASATDQVTFLSIGTLNKVLKSTGTLPSWAFVDYSELTGVPSTFNPTPHNILSASHGDTLTASVVRGDLIIGNSTPKWARLPKNTAYSKLGMDDAGIDVLWRDRETFIELYDDFIMGTAEAGEIGELGWDLGLIGSGSVSYLSSVANHAGVVRSATGATTNNETNIQTGGATAVLGTDLWDMTAIIKIPTITLIEITIGLGSGGAGADTTPHAWFKFKPSISAKWSTATYQTSETVNTDNDGSDVAAGVWYTVRIKRTASNVEFYLNGTLLFTHTTNLPASSMPIILRTVTRTTTARNLDVDYVRFCVRGITR